MKALQVQSKNEDSKRLLRSLKRRNDDKDDVPEKKKCIESTPSPDLRINAVKAWVLDKFSTESITNLIMTFIVRIYCV